MPRPACVDDYNRPYPLGPDERRITKFCPSCMALYCAFTSGGRQEHIDAIKHGIHPARRRLHSSLGPRLDPKKAEERIAQTLEWLQNAGDWVKCSEVARAMGMNDRPRTMSTYLAKLRDRGLVEMKGKGPSTVWRAKPTDAPMLKGLKPYRAERFVGGSRSYAALGLCSVCHERQAQWMRVRGCVMMAYCSDCAKMPE